MDVANDASSGSGKIPFLKNNTVALLLKSPGYPRSNLFVGSSVTDEKLFHTDTIKWQLGSEGTQQHKIVRKYSIRNRSGEIKQQTVTGTFVQNGVTKEAQAARFIANPAGNSSTTAGSGTIVSADGGQSTYVSGLTTGESIDVAAKHVLNAYGNAGNDKLIGDASYYKNYASCFPTPLRNFLGGGGDDPNTSESRTIDVNYFNKTFYMNNRAA